jgi:HAD superfamily phosphoserine phosphatase-like hydrolase
MSRPPNVTAADIIARLESALPRDGSRSLLAFDADGTLWTGDVSCDVFSGTIARRAFREEARATLVADAAAIGLDTSGPLEAIAARLLGALYEGTWEDAPSAAGMATCYAGHTRDEALTLADEILASAELPARTNRAAVEIMSWARSRGVEVVVGSASPIGVVHAAVRHLDIPPGAVLATDLEEDAGRLAPRVLGRSVYGEGKLAALEARRPGVRVLGAFGDGAGDRCMLRAASVTVAVGPSRWLLAEAHTIPGLVVLPVPR